MSKTKTEYYSVDRLEYLKLIQDIITRMANNSFAMKGWCVTLTSGIFGINIWTRCDWAYFSLMFFPIIVFWILDAYYLRQERLYRGLYDRVRKMNESQLDESKYSMIPPQKGDSDYKKSFNFINVLFSITERSLYGSFTILTLAMIIALAITGNISSDVESQAALESIIA